MAWTHATGQQRNPDREKKYLIEPKITVNLDYEPKFYFGASPN